MLFKKAGRGKDDPPSVRVDVTFGDARAQRARLAARSNDGDTLHALIAGLKDPHDREFVLYAALDGIAPSPWIEHLPDRFPDSGTAWAIRGVHTLRRAWHEAGGEAGGPPTADDELARWREQMDEADRDLMHAARLLGEDPVPWSFLVETGAAVGLSFKEICDRFDEADQRAPWLVLAHHHLMRATTPAWSGSDETMFAVAADIAARAPVGSACHDVVALVHLDRGRREPSTPERPGLVAYLQQPAVLGDLDQAARRSVESRSFDPHPVANLARNLFAYAFIAADVPDRARELLRRLGDRPSDVPWGWDDPDAGLAFARARKRVGAPPADDD